MSKERIIELLKEEQRRAVDLRDYIDSGKSSLPDDVAKQMRNTYDAEARNLLHIIHRVENNLI